MDKDNNKMIRHFFLDKTNTIVEGSYNNLGLNPILQIGYGKGLMRGLIHFDIDKIKELVDDKTFANEDKLSFRLKMTNCFSVDSLPYEKDLIRGLGNKARRASSFDLMLFKLPCEFDGGRGFDFESDFWVRENTSRITEGSSWYFAKTGEPWDVDKEFVNDQTKKDSWDKEKYIRIKGGVYKETDFVQDFVNYKNGKDSYIVRNSERTDINWTRMQSWGLVGGILPLSKIGEEYSKYLNGEESIVVGSQHFDFGNENLDIDITDYVMDLLNGECNYGLCLSFAPTYEEADRDIMQYVGFFTDTTNTFFHPYVEANYSEYVSDDRNCFTIGRKNKLYLYASENGNPVNLDELPTCEINGNEARVYQASKGIYYAEVEASKDDFEKDTIYEDNWSIKSNDESDYISLEFVANSKFSKFNVGSSSSFKNMLVPSIYGINDDEKLTRNERREITVDFRKKYTTDKKELVDSAEYRLYIKDGNRELDIIKFTPIEKTFLNNFFIIYTEDLIPNEYYIDIKINHGRETRYFKNVLKFTIISNVTERYE